jgi:hypothetical protein
MALAVRRRQRHCDALDPHRLIAAFGHGVDLAQRPLCARIVGNDLATHGAHQRALSQHGVAARIGVDDPSARIDEEHAGADAVGGVGKGRGFSGLEIDHVADEHRTAHVGHDEPHAPAGCVVHEADDFVAKEAHLRKAGDRLLQ